MIRNALATAIVVYAILAVAVLRECAPLARAWLQIWEGYGIWLLGFSALLILNLFAAVYAVMRKLALKDTGDKLAHLEKQLRGKETISSELTKQILKDRK